MEAFDSMEAYVMICSCQVSLQFSQINGATKLFYSHGQLCGLFRIFKLRLVYSPQFGLELLDIFDLLSPRADKRVIDREN